MELASLRPIALRLVSNIQPQWNVLDVCCTIVWAIQKVKCRNILANVYLKKVSAQRGKMPLILTNLIIESFCLMPRACFFFILFQSDGSVYFFCQWYFRVYVCIQPVMFAIRWASLAASVVVNIDRKCDKKSIKFDAKAKIHQRVNETHFTVYRRRQH